MSEIDGGLGPPLEPPDDLWAQAVAVALDGGRTADEVGYLVPGTDDSAESRVVDDVAEFSADLDHRPYDDHVTDNPDVDVHASYVLDHWSFEDLGDAGRSDWSSGGEL